MSILNQRRTTRPERGKRDKELRQQALIEAATAVFAEHGYDAATTREVAERAGCSEGLIHRYFEGKRGLLLAIIESKIADGIEDFRSRLPDRGSAEQEIEQILLWHLRVLWERRDFMRVTVSEAIIDPEVGHSAVAGINKQHVNFIIEKLRRHAEAGRVRGDADLEAVGEAIAGLGFLFGFMQQVVFGVDREYVRRLAVGTARVFSRGVVAQAPAPHARAQSPRRKAPQ
jgi:AcrR family transcriptional regulator